MAQASSSEPTRMVFLLHGEDSFRMRLRLGELVRALLQRAPIASGDRLAAGRARRAGRARTGAATANAAANTLVDAVESAAGTIERLERIAPVDVARWIEARGSLHAAKLGTDAVAALASAVGSDTERIEQEVKK